MNNYYIYFHYTLDNNELFYIGKGKDNRAYNHLGRNDYWKRVVDKHGIVIKIVKSSLSESLAFKYEIYFISKLKPKCNLTPGGYGGNTTAKYSPKQKEEFYSKCSISKKKWWETVPKIEREKILKKSHEAISNMWKNMNTIKKSEEQRRRNSLRRKKAILCLNNNKAYIDANEASKDLNIRAASIRRVACGERPHTQNYKFIYAT